MAHDPEVPELFDSFLESVPHVATAIWRYLRGNRFSADIDVYLPSAGESGEEKFVSNLPIKGVNKLEIRDDGEGKLVQGNSSGRGGRLSVNFE